MFSDYSVLKKLVRIILGTLIHTSPNHGQEKTRKNHKYMKYTNRNAFFSVIMHEIYSFFVQ